MGNEEKAKLRRKVVRGLYQCGSHKLNLSLRYAIEKMDGSGLSS